MKRAVLVTGATGFLGRFVVRELCQEHEVHALVRPTADRAPLSDLPLTWHTGDLTDPPSVEAALAATAARALELGSEDGPHLVHSAAVISYRSSDGALQRSVNVEGTRTLLEIARRHGVRRSVYVSSIVTVGHATTDAPVDEDTEWNGASLGVDYVSTKREAEVLALEHADELGLRVVNPAAIFGPVGPTSNTSRFVCSVARGQLGPLAPPGGMTVVGVRDVACGVRLALEQGRTARRYLLGESYLAVGELARAVSRCLADLGLAGRAPRATLPRAVWPAVRAAARFLDRIRPLELAPPQALTLLELRWHCDAGRARRELGWAPAPFESVLRETIGHLRESGHL